MAQLVEHIVHIDGVTGSSPVATTMARQAKMLAGFFLYFLEVIMKSESKHPLIHQLSICGQVAEHKSEMIRTHLGDEAQILSALNEEQQSQLQSLLDILQSAWLKDHAEHHVREAE